MMTYKAFTTETLLDMYIFGTPLPGTREIIAELESRGYHPLILYKKIKKIVKRVEGG